jgi:hypothetical protein
LKCLIFQFHAWTSAPFLEVGSWLEILVVSLGTTGSGWCARVLKSKWLAKRIQQLEEQLGVRRTGGIGTTRANVSLVTSNFCFQLQLLPFFTSFYRLCWWHLNVYLNRTSWSNLCNSRLDILLTLRRTENSRAW